MWPAPLFWGHGLGPDTLGGPVHHAIRDTASHRAARRGGDGLGVESQARIAPRRERWSHGSGTARNQVATRPRGPRRRRSGRRRALAGITAPESEPKIRRGDPVPVVARRRLASHRHARIVVGACKGQRCPLREHRHDDIDRPSRLPTSLARRVRKGLADARRPAGGRDRKSWVSVPVLAGRGPRPCPWRCAREGEPAITPPVPLMAGQTSRRLKLLRVRILGRRFPPSHREQGKGEDTRALNGAIE